MKMDKDLKEWHPMFCAALKEYFRDYEEVRIIPEYNISKNPLRIDVLIKVRSHKSF